MLKYCIILNHPWTNEFSISHSAITFFIKKAKKIYNLFGYVIFFVFLFSECTNADKTIKIKGSDTEVNLTVQLAETFRHADSSVFISISGGGSGLGIASLLNSNADMANSSRNIDIKEIELFQKKGLQIDSFIFAQDAVAFVVSKELPIDSISTNDLKLILNGTVSNWSSIWKKNININIYGRQSNSGTYVFVKKKLGIEFSSHANEMIGNAQILDAIKNDSSGIGYVGAGYVLNGGTKGIKVLTIYTQKNEKAVSPLDAAAIAENKYFFQRPLFQYYKVSSSHKIKPFLDFEKSPIGKKIIQSEGYYLPKI